ncbi:NAD(P)/FAD-dependent oxidoreductase [Nocardiopsis rhodophaea]|uniref:NAD(P)/FAD-dependent oxidoreductase n=1 Tax=Nocardiopsis rhodophaea TaxID=280238 RepID=A0ABN2T6X3_9ACTN
MYDVIVVGAGPAGLNAALILGRALRRVLVVDSGEPRNARAHAMHGFLSRDGIDPREFRRIAREDLGAYVHVSIRDAAVSTVVTEDEGAGVVFEDGTIERTRTVLLATGRRDRLPDVKGVAEHWGAGVYGCPYCHGHEVIGKRLGVLGARTPDAHLAVQLTRFGRDVVLFTGGKPEYDEEAAAALQVTEVEVRTGAVEEVLGSEGAVTGVRLADSEVARDAVFLKTKLDPHGDIVESLGCEMLDDGSVRIDEHGHTSLDRIYAAGEAARLPNWPSPWIHAVTSAALGAMVALSIDHDLIVADVRAAFAVPAADAE